jgi:hypothetical protein
MRRHHTGVAGKITCGYNWVVRTRLFQSVVVFGVALGTAAACADDARTRDITGSGGSAGSTGGAASGGASSGGTGGTVSGGGSGGANVGGGAGAAGSAGADGSAGAAGSASDGGLGDAHDATMDHDGATDGGWPPTK